MSELFSKIAGTGSYLPEKVLTNDDMAKIVDTSDEWIFQRTGIKERHIAADGELTSDLAVRAASAALESAGIPASGIDLIVLATTTPDNLFPATACRVQAKLGAASAVAFDIQAVCSGFLFALAAADQLVKSGGYGRALVIGAETLSRIVDWSDRSTCVLFGDGAGAVVLEATEEKTGVLSSVIKSDGAYYDILKTTSGPSVSGDVGKIYMSGQDVFKLAVAKVPEISAAAVEKAGLAMSDVDWFIPHQANARIIESAIKRMGMPEEKVVMTIGSQANTSAASIPISLDFAVNGGKIKRGDRVLLTAMGGGFTWGSLLFEF
ncbi:MAG: ketoacyl-ACP synthase III [Rickettsiales bacterium]|jgi:3-oxoacyl-[acyl-carrier-protein] synthase-3|nr:ketoacyl-ACP synthase III [Rickettsiales bacterium]